MYDFPASPTVGQVYNPTSGPSWTWDGTVWKTFQTNGEIQIVKTFIPGVQGAATNYTYNKPANLRQLEFEGVAAGGSGGSALATGASTWSLGASGGGGSWGKKLFTAAALPASVAIVIGAPGAASSSGAGNAAAATTFGALITLPGGTAGPQGANITYTGGGSATVPAPATAMPTGCDVAKPGEPGEPATVNFTVGGGGVWGLLGKAGGSPWGTGATAASGTGYGGAAGVGYGWGSSGNINAASGTLKNSVPGGPGAVLLTEYLATAAGPVYQTALDQNLLVNPAIQHAQDIALNTTVNATAAYVADQWMTAFSGPTGGTHLSYAAYPANSGGGLNGSLGIGSQATAYSSVAAGNYAQIQQYLEGLMVNTVLRWGQSDAIAAVLSFEARSPMAGTFVVGLRSYAADRSIVFPVTFSAGELNVWKKFVFTVPAVTSGTFALDNTGALIVNFNLMCGTTYQAPSSGAWLNSGYFGLAGQSNFLSSGVQQTFGIRNIGLYPDPGSTGVAPPFTVPNYNDELLRCRRYYAKYNSEFISGGYGPAAGQAYYSSFQYQTAMRVAATISFAGVTNVNTSGLTMSAQSLDGVRVYLTNTAVGSYYGLATQLIANARM